MAEPLTPEEGFVDISENKDGGLLKKILVEGQGEESPPPGSDVQVHYVGTLHSDGSKFDSSRDRPGFFKFAVGVGQVIKGWDTGICTMKRGEKCILRCRSDYAYGDSGSPPKIPGGATLNFEVELFSWKEKVKPAGQMSMEERRAYATKMKEQGTEAFKAGDWATAVNRYQDGAEYITYSPDGDDQGSDDDDDKAGEKPAELSEEDKQLAVALLNNSAMANLKLGENDSAKYDCVKALEYDHKNVKAMFRKGQAELALGNFKACVEVCGRMLEEDPQNKDAEQLKLKAAHAEQKQKKNEKAMYSKMFG
jgi:peptidylprolyl isomerase